MPVSFGESGSNGRGNPEGSETFIVKNLTENGDEASDDSGASFITFSNDYAVIRNYMKEGDVANLADENEMQFSLSGADPYLEKSTKKYGNVEDVAIPIGMTWRILIRFVLCAIDFEFCLFWT